MLSNFNPFNGDINLNVSIINTNLRDNYDSLISLCEDINIDYNELINYLNNHNYQYIESINQIKSI